MISLEKIDRISNSNLPDSANEFVRRIMSETGNALHSLPVIGTSYNELTDTTMKVWRLMKKLRDVKSEEEKLKDALSKPDYTPKPFDEPAPFIDKYRDEITAEAQNEIGHFLVRNREQKIQDYVNNKLEKVYSEAVKTWNEKKAIHDQSQLKLKQEYANSKAKAIAEANEFLHPDESSILRDIQMDCMNCGLPFDANLIINNDEKGFVYIAISAPNTDIIPERKEYTHSRGTGYKDKTKTEINYDYISLISGMGYLFASIIFNASARINKILTVCTRPAFNSAKATISMECLYSVLFDRNAFSWVTDDLRFLPFENLAFFPHSVNLDYLSAPHNTDPFDFKEAYGRPAGATPFLSSEPIPITGSSNAYDDLLADSARLIVSSQQGSTSLIQRRLSIGFARAGRIMDQMEQLGIIGPQNGYAPRQVLVADMNALEQLLKATGVI